MMTCGLPKRTWRHDPNQLEATSLHTVTKSVLLGSFNCQSLQCTLSTPNCHSRVTASRSSSSEDILEETLDEVQDEFREQAAQERRKTYHLALSQKLFWILREVTQPPNKNGCDNGAESGPDEQPSREAAIGLGRTFLHGFRKRFYILALETNSVSIKGRRLRQQ